MRVNGEQGGMLSSARMFTDLLGAIWRQLPKSLRRWSMRATHTRFTVTAAGLVLNKAWRLIEPFGLHQRRYRKGCRRINEG